MIQLKQLIRKPQGILLFLFVTLFGVLVLVINTYVMDQNYKSIDTLYMRTNVSCHLIPEDPLSEAVRILPMYLENLKGREELESWFGYVEGPFFFADYDPENPDGTYRIAYGVRDYEQFFRETYVEYETETADTKADFSRDIAVCFAEQGLLTEKELSVGDMIFVRGGDAHAQFNEGAPVLSFRIIGSYDASISTLYPGSIVIPEPCFFTKGGKKLTYDSATYVQWYQYRSFSFRLKPSYNKVLDETIDSLMPFIKRAGNYTVHTDARELEAALRPLEQRVRIQQSLSRIIRIVLLLLSMLAASRMAVQARPEVLIRRIYGERRTWIACSLSTLYAALIAALMVPEALMVLFFSQIRTLLVGYLPLLYIFSVCASCTVMLYLSFRPLIQMYQSLNREA